MASATLSTCGGDDVRVSTILRTGTTVTAECHNYMDAGEAFIEIVGLDDRQEPIHLTLDQDHIRGILALVEECHRALVEEEEVAGEERLPY